MSGVGKSGAQASLRKHAGTGAAGKAGIGARFAAIFIVLYKI